MIMTIAQLTKEILKREGKKKQIDIAQMKEILAILSDMSFEDDLLGLEYIFYTNGEKRAKKKKK